MEIKVNLTVDLSENTLKVLTALLGLATTVTGPKETPVVNMEKATSTKAKAGKGAAAAVEAPKGEPATDNAPSAGTDQLALENEETMRLKIRQKVVALRDAGKKDFTVSLMADFGAAALSKVPADRLLEFYDRLNAGK